FATVLAALLLRERVRARRWSAIAIGLFGVVVILRPFGPFDVNMLMLLASAATAAMGSITVKFLSRSESPVTIVTYMVIYLAPILVASARYVAHREARLTRRDPAKVSGGRPQPAPPT